MSHNIAQALREQLKDCHSDVTTTLNIYSHVLQRSNQEAANTLDALIFKQSVNQ